jgi:hypothetical protein
MFGRIDGWLEKASGGAGPVFRWIWALLLAGSVSAVTYLMFALL